MDELLLNELTAKRLKAFVSHPSHSLMLVGAVGSGKQITAEAVLRAILGQKLTVFSNYLHINPRENSISIDEIRQLKRFLKLKTLGKAYLRRGVIIEDAQLLTTEAQNALLKVLEEPPADSLIILTCASLSSMLPTITSRVQVINVEPASKKQALNFFKKYSSTEIEKAYLVSSGNIGLMSALLNSDRPHDLAPAIKSAKQIIKSTLPERLSRVDELAKDKTGLAIKLDALYKIVHAAQHNAIARGDEADVKRLNSSLETILFSQEALAKNANAKLLITNLLLNV